MHPTDYFIRAAVRGESIVVAERTQFVLLELPALLRELLAQAIEANGDCDTYAARDPTELDPLDSTLQPAAVIIGLTNPADAAVVPAILMRWPQAQVVTVTAVGRDLMHYRMTVERHALGELSPAELVLLLHEQANVNSHVSP